MPEQGGKEYVFEYVAVDQSEYVPDVTQALIERLNS